MDALRTYLEAFGVALVGSIVVTLLVRGVARKWPKLELVAKPRADRWHKKPTALYGGVAIFVGFLIAYLFRRPAAIGGDAILVLCSSGMFLVGLMDDRVSLKPHVKLLAQIAFATMFTAFGLRLHWLPNPIADQGLTIFWLVGVTNALNLLDNIDGAAAGIAAIASGYLVYFCHDQGQPESAMLAAAFCGAVLGFLIFNFNPASIFMGDCGALFLGFFLGGLAVVNTNVPGARRNLLAVLTIPVLLLFMPILDTTLVTISRRYHRRRVSQGGKDHTSHRLVALGMSERSATLSLWAIAGTAGGIAVLVNSVSMAVAALCVSLFVMALLFLMIFLGRVHVYGPAEVAHAEQGRALLPTLADLSNRARLFEIANDLVVIILCYYAAFLLRFEPSGAEAELLMPHFIRSLPLVIMTQFAAFGVTGLYRGIWSSTGLNDLTRIMRSVVAAVVLASLAIFLVFQFQGYSRAVMIIDGALLTLGLAGSRLSFQFLDSWLRSEAPTEGKSGRRTLIYGAGQSGELLLREIEANRDLGMVPVGFLDDDPQKSGRVVHGLPVVGSLSEMQRIMLKQKPDLVIASSVKIDALRWAEVERACGENGVGCQRMRIAFD